MKQCKKCKSNKDEWLFSKDKNRSDGLFPWCKECKSKSDAESHIKHRDKRIDNMKKSYHKNAN